MWYTFYLAYTNCSRSEHFEYQKTFFVFYLFLKFRSQTILKKDRSLKCNTFKKVSNARYITPDWFKKGVEASILAPTAVNQQKFSFEYVEIRNNSHLVKANKGFSLIGYTRIDLGIAKFHFEIVVGNEIFDW